MHNTKVFINGKYVYSLYSHKSGMSRLSSSDRVGILIVAVVVATIALSQLA